MVQIARLVATMEADPSAMLAAFSAVQRGTLGLASDLERLSAMMQSNLASATDRAAAGLSRVPQPANNAKRAIDNIGEGVGRTSERFRQLTPPVERALPVLTRVGPAARTAGTGVDALTRSSNTGRDALGRFTGAGRQAGDEAKSLGTSVDKAGGAFGRFVVRVNNAQKALSEGFTPAQKAAKEIADRFQSAGTKLSLGVTLPIAFAAGSVVNAAAEMDSLKRGLLAVAGSSEEAERQLTRLQDVAKLPGLGFQEAIRGSISLQAAGFSARSAERSLQAFGNALATVGKGKADLDGVTLALTQIASKGKISAEEINQLSERVPQVRKAMQAAFGTADTEKLQKSGLSAADFVERLTTELLKLPMVTGGVGNAMENLSDAFFRARASIGTALLPAIVPLVEGLANLLAKVREVDPGTLRMALSFTAVAAAAGPLAWVVGTVISAVTGLAAALAVGVLPLIAIGGPILIGLGLVAAAFVSTGLAALQASANAEAAAEKFRAALSTMNTATLISVTADKLALSAELGALRGQLEKDLATQDAIVRRVDAAARRANSVGSNPASLMGSPDAEKARNRMRVLNQQLADVKAQQAIADRQAREGADAFNRLNVPQPKFAPLNLDTGADKLASQRKALQDLTADMKALFMFSGVTFKTDLPQDFQQQLALVDSLTDRIAQAGDALRKMGASAPEGAVQAFARLNIQLETANRTLMQMADSWNTLASRAPNLGVVPVNNVSGRINPTANQNVNPSGRDVAAGGSIFGGEFGQRLGLASTALNVLKESALQTGRTLLNAFEQAASQGGQFASNVASTFSDLRKGGKSFIAAGPQALAMAGAMEVATGMFRVLQPALDALAVPLQIFGEILGTLILPVLKIVFPVFKAVAIAASFLAEVIARVNGFVLTSIGSLVRGLGRLVNKLPGSPGDPLVKAGQAMINLGNSFKDAAKEMAERRRELQGLTFEDAMERASGAADKLSESLTNVPPLFDIALRRMQASRGESITARPLVAPASRSTDSSTPAPSSLQFVFQPGSIPSTSGATASEVATQVVRAIVSKLSTASDSDARELASTLRLAGV